MRPVHDWKMNNAGLFFTLGLNDSRALILFGSFRMKELEFKCANRRLHTLHYKRSYGGIFVMRIFGARACVYLCEGGGGVVAGCNC